MKIIAAFWPFEPVSSGGKSPGQWKLPPRTPGLLLKAFTESMNHCRSGNTSSTYTPAVSPRLWGSYRLIITLLISFTLTCLQIFTLKRHFLHLPRRLTHITAHFSLHIVLKGVSIKQHVTYLYQHCFPVDSAGGPHIIDLITDAAGRWKFKHGPHLAPGLDFGHACPIYSGL